MMAHACSTWLVSGWAVRRADGKVRVQTRCKVRVGRQGDHRCRMLRPAHRDQISATPCELTPKRRGRRGARREKRRTRRSQRRQERRWGDLRSKGWAEGAIGGANRIDKARMGNVAQRPPDPIPILFWENLAHLRTPAPESAGAQEHTRCTEMWNPHAWRVKPYLAPTGSFGCRTCDRQALAQQIQRSTQTQSKPPVA